MNLDLDKKTAIVTGGASNIGRAISISLAKEGANVIVADLDTEQGQITSDFADEQYSGEVIFHQCDVTDTKSVKSLFEMTVGKYGTVDVLVNAVGWDELQYFTATEPSFWNKIIEINFKGILNCTFEALKIMNAKGSGSIVSISSDASKQGEPREAVYGAMKAGVNSLMKTVAKENGRYGVRCNTVCPGVTIPQDDTEVGDNSMWKNIDSMFTQEQLAKIAKTLPLKKIGRPQDVANAVLFLASNKVAGHITGQVISVSGGYSMV